MSTDPSIRSKPKSPPLTKADIKPGDGGRIRIPQSNDVLCGRGGRINAHEGNVKFREIVNDLKHTYLAKTTKKLDKAHIAASIVTKIRSMDPPGRFLKEDGTSGYWIDIGDEKARKKAGQALREDAPDIRSEIEAEEKEDHVLNMYKNMYYGGPAMGMMPGGPVGPHQMGMYPGGGYGPMTPMGPYNPPPFMTAPRFRGPYMNTPAQQAQAQQQQPYNMAQGMTAAAVVPEGAPVFHGYQGVPPPPMGPGMMPYYYPPQQQQQPPSNQQPYNMYQQPPPGMMPPPHHHPPPPQAQPPGGAADGTTTPNIPPMGTTTPIGTPIPAAAATMVTPLPSGGSSTPASPQQQPRPPSARAFVPVSNNNNKESQPANNGNSGSTPPTTIDGNQKKFPSVSTASTITVDTDVCNMIASTISPEPLTDSTIAAIATDAKNDGDDPNTTATAKPTTKPDNNNNNSHSEEGQGDDDEPSTTTEKKIASFFSGTNMQFQAAMGASMRNQFQSTVRKVTQNIPTIHPLPGLLGQHNCATHTKNAAMPPPPPPDTSPNNQFVSSITLPSGRQISASRYQRDHNNSSLMKRSLLSDVSMGNSLLTRSLSFPPGSGNAECLSMSLTDASFAALIDDVVEPPSHHSAPATSGTDGQLRTVMGRATAARNNTNGVDVTMMSKTSAGTQDSSVSGGSSSMKGGNTSSSGSVPTTKKSVTGGGLYNSGSSKESAWLRTYKNMGSISSDMNPWLNESSRSIMSDISADLMALDLHGDIPQMSSQMSSLPLRLSSPTIDFNRDD